MDRRITPFSGRKAAISLKGQIEAEAFVEPQPHSALGNPFLYAKPEGARDRQLLTGDRVDVYDRKDGWAFVQAERDLYCGWLLETALAPAGVPTHWLTERTSWLHPTASVRLPALADLHLGAKVRRLGPEDGVWSQVEVAGLIGWLPTQHLAPIGEHASDPVSVAKKFLGTPYIWAGNTGFGIDCSGLAQAALLATGTPCPGDSDQQELAFGPALADSEPNLPGDLYFWKGHVAMVADPQTLIHATGAFMQVVLEPLEAALARIAQQGNPVTSRRRPRP